MVVDDFRRKGPCSESLQLPYDEHFAGAEFDVAVAQLDRQPPLENQEQVIRVWVRMPDELALRLGEEDLVSVVAADDTQRPGLAERRERRREVNLRRYRPGAMFG